MMFIKTFFSFVFVLGISFSANAQLLNDDTDLQATCEGFSLSKPWSYCIYKQSGSDNPDVIYFFHGAGGNPKEYMEWVDMRAEWRTLGLKMPTVIAVSFGPFWLLAEKSTSPRSGLLNYVVDKVMPMLEAKLGNFSGKRSLLSKSMGSFNTTQLVMKHPTLFSKAAIACPAILNVSPFAPQAEVDAFVQRSGADPEKVAWYIRLQKTFYANQTDWEKDDPLLAGKTTLGERTPEVYMTCGKADQYGFFEGTEKFTILAKETRVLKFVWFPHEGNHCQRDEVAMARFLLTP
jgi:hypothetical protein